MSDYYVERPTGRVVSAPDEPAAWERHEPVYRVFLRGVGPDTPEIAWTYDVTGVSVATVVAWARQRSAAGHLAHAVALVCDRPPVGPDEPGAGLTWLVPWDESAEAEAPYEGLTDAPRKDHHRMSDAISVAWVGMSLNTEMCLGMDLAWEVLVDQEEWRAWVHEVRNPSAPSLYLAVRDGLDVRRLRKTRDGASLQLPASEVETAYFSGTLVQLYLGVIHALYTKWAAAHGRPLPPALPD